MASIIEKFSQYSESEYDPIFLFEEYEKRNTLATVLMMTCMTLRDEYGFGFDRMNRFIRRFNTKTECLVEDYVNWKDLQQTLLKETGILVPLPEEFMMEE